MNNEKAGYLAKLAGIPDDPFRYLAKFPGLGEALIFFSHPFLVSRQEKDGFWKKIDGNHDRNISCR